MPRYDFINDKSGEIKELIFSMKEDKVFIDETGYEWRRLFSVPQASIDTIVDCFDSNAFVEKTGKMKGNMGEIWEYSQTMSDKRAAKNGGVDDIAVNRAVEKKIRLAETRKKAAEERKAALKKHREKE